jgi:hypothetical protein
MAENISIEKYGIRIQTIEDHDAEFILKLRTDNNLSRFLSHTSTDLNAQREWIRRYKEREKEGKEYYFIALHNGTRYGTTRIYNIESDCFEVGSWLFSPDAPIGVSILTDIIGREFAFKKLGARKCKFTVRRENHTVIKYHKSYKPILIKETQEDFFFMLTREAFETYKNKLINVIIK